MLIGLISVKLNKNRHFINQLLAHKIRLTFSRHTKMEGIYQMLNGLWRPQKTIKGKSKRKKKKDSKATLALKQLLSAPKKKKLLVLDLDETLVHSTSKGSRNHDKNCTLIEVLIEKHVCLYYVYKRPHVDYFLKKVSLFTKIRCQSGIKL